MRTNGNVLEAPNQAKLTSTATLNVSECERKPRLRLSPGQLGSSSEHIDSTQFPIFVFRKGAAERGEVMRDGVLRLGLGLRNSGHAYRG